MLLNSLFKKSLKIYKKIADLEQKSESIQKSLIKSLANLIQVGDNIQIKTPSFLFNLFKLNSSNVPTELSVEKNQILMPSFCSLSKCNCSEQVVLLKVSF
jgi:hypothetical protein